MIRTLKGNSFLIEELIKRDFKKKYKRSVLGVAWSLLNPLLTLLIMRLVFKRFFGTDIENYTVYLFCGNIVFSFFSEATSESLATLLGNSGIFSKVSIPKYFFVLSKNVQVFINFLLTMLVFLALCFIDGITFSFRFLMLVYPVLMLTVFNIGVGLILSALFVFFRDVRYLWSVLTQLLMYVSAIFYSIEPFSDAVRSLFLLNPIYVFIRYFRQIVLDAVIPSPGLHLLAAGYALGALALGLLTYKKLDDEFMYYI